ncbi:MAG TPA: DHA2 family efflux MFS transporter permease subunit [Pseudonocardia sp.]|jgi:EmrB/QacA subfamily drug resistance transporter|nr:DHA2 family efflux MFS transporter permease subunit [Pseudonocardia sp.]
MARAGLDDASDVLPDVVLTTEGTPASSPPRPPAPPPAAAQEPKERGWGLPLVVLIVGMFMSVLDTSIVNVAIPVMQKEFGVSTEDIQWVSTSYSLCEGIVVPASAWLGAKFGLRRTYLSALILFVAVSAACGMSPNLGSMVLFRFLQAIPGGVLPVICLSMLYRLVPPQKLGAAMGLYGLGIVVAPGVGPTLGGYFVEYVDWRLIFYVNVPIGILGAIAAAAVLPRFPASDPGKFDLPGFASIATALLALLLAFEEGSKWGWTSYPILILVAGGINLLVLFVIIELQSSHPLLNVRVFMHWPFVNSLLLISMMSVGLFAVLFYVPQFLQNSRGITPWNTGLTLLPQALAMMVLMPLAGVLYDKIGPRWPALVGLLMTGSGMLLLSQITPDVSRGELVLWMVTMTSGLALGMMPIMTSGISSLPPTLTDHGSAFNTLTQRVSSALGLAILTVLSTHLQAQGFADRSALLSGDGPSVDPRIAQMQAGGQSGLLPLWSQLRTEVLADAYSTVFLVAGVAALSGVGLALFLRSGKATSPDGGPVMVH